MTSKPYYKRYPGDYKQDTSHLDFAEHGFYTLVLDELWINNGKITKEKLRKSLKITEKKLEKFLKKTKEFFTFSGDEISQNRMTKEYAIYADKCRKNKENSEKGVEARRRKQAEMDNRTVNQSVDEKTTHTRSQKPEARSIKSKRGKVFSPPHHQEVKQYCFERNNSVDVHRFMDFYTSKGWMIGKNKMKDWQAAVRTWERGDSTNSNRPKSFAEQQDDEREETLKNAASKIDYADRMGPGDCPQAGNYRGGDDETFPRLQSPTDG
jgi:uncharacterized protein YdaU (DUF1376 family)